MPPNSLRPAVLTVCQQDVTRRLEADAFQTECTCLASNMECAASCGCSKAACANRAISRCSALKMGKDIVESDVWGLDCYTRRNILDGGCMTGTMPGPADERLGI